MKKDKIDFLYEWTVWAHLQSESNLELVLLKGHLLLELAIETTLSRHNIKNAENYSFHRKITELEKCISENQLAEIIIDSLYYINRLRNKLAHEVNYEINSSDLEDWSNKIIANLNGTKWTKFTFRTKVMHAFSILTINILKGNLS